MHFSVQLVTYLIINQVKSMLLFEKQESVLVRERNWKVVVGINYENILSDSITIDKLMLNFNKTLNILKKKFKKSQIENCRLLINMFLKTTYQPMICL